MKTKKQKGTKTKKTSSKIRSYVQSLSKIEILHHTARMTTGSKVFTVNFLPSYQVISVQLSTTGTNEEFYMEIISWAFLLN